MSSYFPLPQIMVAPNGARKTTDDHSEIPVTIDRLVETASDCFDAGARAMHFHVRDENQQHVLDAGLYREAIAELSQKLPALHLQMTTESVGRYSPEDMRRVTEEHNVIVTGYSAIHFSKCKRFVHFLELHGFRIAIGLGADLLNVC